MSETKPKARLGRPVRYDGKELEITFMIHPDDEAFIAELANELKCSRSDALTECLRRCRRQRNKHPR